jgi:hypothetical protein
MRLEPARTRLTAAALGWPLGNDDILHALGG